MSHASSETAQVSAYLRYQELLKQLQDCMAAGEGESEIGEALRDEMDLLWPCLSEDQSRRMRGLSADLYSLNHQEIPRAITSQEHSKKIAAESKEALEEGRFDELLDLLRFRPGFLPEPAVAYLRGRCWLELADPLPAVWFFDFASSLVPGHPSYGAMAMHALVMAGRLDDAVKRAHDAVADSSSSSVLLLSAARALFTAARCVSQESARKLYKEVVETVDAAFSRQSPQDPLVSLPGLRNAGRLCRAMAYERLGDADEAARQYDSLLRDEPSDSRNWLVAGIFEIDRNPARADERFERAICLGTDSAWPFLFLSHSRLLARQYKKVVELAAKGLLLAGPNSAHAVLLESLAIAHAELSAPIDLVRSIFDAAITLDPTNSNIQKNRDAFERTVGAGGPASSAEFDSPPLPDIALVRAALDADQAKAPLAMGLAA